LNVKEPGSLADRREETLLKGTEFHFSETDFTRIATIMRTETGIALERSKANLIYSRLAKRLRALHLTTFREYCDIVSDRTSPEERQTMIAALTTNVTAFFREPHHFEHLKTAILPGVAAALKAGARVRFWSAACSSGQEPYSIALTVLSMIPDAASRDVKILATDLDHNMVAKGAAGIYDSSLVSGIQPALLQRWFNRRAAEPGQYEVGPELRALVSFRRLNLIEPWPMRGTFHAIFCRNVVIYFDHDTQVKLWSRMVPALHQAGALYIGHSERVDGPAASLLATDGITTYRPLQQRHS
jgi:chemotaxis protein methyltransferase CheR